MKKKHMIIVGAIVLVWAGVAGFIILNGKKENKESAKASIESYLVPSHKKIIVNGIVSPTDSKSYYSVAGAKADIKVKNGDIVKKGDLLISYSDGAVKEYAPFDGKVYVDKNAESATNQAILKIRSNDFYVKAQASEKDLANIKENAKANILVLSNNASVSGKVTSISDEPQTTSSVQAATQASPVSNYDLDISLDSKDNIVNGYHVQATIETSANTEVKIPKSAIITENGKKYVYIIKDSKLQKQEVKVKDSSDSLVVATSGIKENDKIVEKPTKDMKEGQSVE